jgi:hypothetical protein
LTALKALTSCAARYHRRRVRRQIHRRIVRTRQSWQNTAAGRVAERLKAPVLPMLGFFPLTH